MSPIGSSGACRAARRNTTRAGLAFLIAASLPGIGYAQAGPCADPWINQAFQQIYRRAPIGGGKNIGECDVTRYGNGHWSGYQDLVMKIEQHGTGSHAMPTTSTGSGLLGNSSAGLAGNGSSLVGSNGNGIVAQGGGNIVAQGGGNIVAQGGGNLVGSNGFRSVQSVDKPRASPGRYLVVPGGSLVDSNGNVVRQAGTYTLVARNGGYAIGTGAGARAATAGTVVTP